MEIEERRFKNVEKQVLDLRDERGLSKEHQKKNFRVDYFRELLAYAEAERDGNEHKIIDAICNMCVVAINAGFSFVPSSKEDEEGYTPWFRVVYLSSGCEANNVGSLAFELSRRGYDPCLCLLEKLKELKTMDNNSEEDGRASGAHTLEEAKWKLSEEWLSSFHKCIKEDEEYWYFHSDYHENDDSDIIKIKKWYSPNYEGCRVNGEAQ